MTSVTDQNRQLMQSYLEAFKYPQTEKWRNAVSATFAPNAEINVVHPFNEMAGPEAYFDVFVLPLLNSFKGLYRRDYIAMAGAFDGEEWITSTGYYCGHFAKPWLGIRPTGAMAYLRVGEFHRIDNGKIVESYIFLDIPELMIAAGQWPIKDSPGKDRGYTGLLMGPTSGDGMLFDTQEETESKKSYQMVTDMLSGLATKDEAWRPYWHENMVWYGPAAFGSFLGINNFAGFQVPFESAFEGWAGGSAGNGRTRHFTRFGDGNYTCSGGWPSLSGTQVKPFLDQPASNKMLYMRVCDWWRREGDLLVENWIFVDIPHVLLQLGVDVLGDLEKNA